MPTRITSLTPEQDAAMPGYAQEWIKRGLLTTPADWPRVEDGIRRCYEHAGLPWHGNIIRVSSPIVVAIAGPTAGSVLKSPHRAVRGAVHGAVHGAVDGAVRGAVDGAVHDAVRDAWWHYLGGSFWSGWHSWGLFFRDVCDLEFTDQTWDKAQAYSDAQSAGWWWPHADFVIVSDRPDAIHLERVGPDGWGSHRLHHDAGPAIRWRDGWSLHFWHGLHVPGWVITDPTPGRIMAEENVEIRRAAIESFGWPEFTRAAGLSLIASEPDPGNEGQTLHLYDAPEDLTGVPARVLVMTNGTVERDGTRRQYGEMVPSDVSRPSEGAAWRTGLSHSDYMTLCHRT